MKLTRSLILLMAFLATTACDEADPTSSLLATSVISAKYYVDYDVETGTVTADASLYGKNILYVPYHLPLSGGDAFYLSNATTGSAQVPFSSQSSQC